MKPFGRIAKVEIGCGKRFIDVSTWLYILPCKINNIGVHIGTLRSDTDQLRFIVILVGNKTFGNNEIRDIDMDILDLGSKFLMKIIAQRVSNVCMYGLG